MKKRIIFGAFIIFAAGTLFCDPFKQNTKVYVSVKSTYLKSSQELFSSKICNMTYGDCLIVLESNEKFSKVCLQQNPSLTGWISNGSITKKKISKKSTASGASQEELALAGKGFSKSAEETFKKGKANLNFDQIDKIEKISIKDSELAQFIIEGHLAGWQEIENSNQGTSNEN